MKICACQNNQNKSINFGTTKRVGDIGTGFLKGKSGPILNTVNTIAGRIGTTTDRLIKDRK